MGRSKWVFNEHCSSPYAHLCLHLYNNLKSIDFSCINKMDFSFFHTLHTHIFLTNVSWFQSSAFPFDHFRENVGQNGNVSTCTSWCNGQWRRRISATVSGWIRCSSSKWNWRSKKKWFSLFSNQCLSCKQCSNSVSLLFNRSRKCPLIISIINENNNHYALERHLLYAKSN